MGLTHLKRSSKALTGNFVHIPVDIGIVFGKPPYVCAHYPLSLTHIYNMLRWSIAQNCNGGNPNHEGIVKKQIKKGG